MSARPLSPAEIRAAIEAALDADPTVRGVGLWRTMSRQYPGMPKYSAFMRLVEQVRDAKPPTPNATRSRICAVVQEEADRMERRVFRRLEGILP